MVNKETFFRTMAAVGVNIDAERKVFEKVIDKEAQTDSAFSIWLTRAALDVAAR